MQHPLHSVHYTAYIAQHILRGLPAWGQQSGHARSAADSIARCSHFHLNSCLQQPEDLNMLTHLAVREGFAHAQRHSQLHVLPSLETGTHRATKESLQLTYTDCEAFGMQAVQRNA